MVERIEELSGGHNAMDIDARIALLLLIRVLSSRRH